MENRRGKDGAVEYQEDVNRHFFHVVELFNWSGACTHRIENM
jgi:hypothetical protein